MIKCTGCGELLQSANPNDLGYVPVSATVSRGDHVYCRRCYKANHYGTDFNSIDHERLLESEYQNELDQRYVKMMRGTSSTKTVFMLVIDSYDIKGGFIPHLADIVGNASVLILVNKIDCLPAGTQIGNIRSLVLRYASEHKIKVNDVFFVSGMTGKEIPRVIEFLNRQLNNKKKDVNNKCCVLGAASVGKSTILNRLIEHFAPNEPLLTTSKQPQTTIDIVRVQIGANSMKEPFYLLDSPGYIYFGNYQTYLSLKSLKMVVPRKPIKVRNYQLQGKQTIIIGGLAIFDFYEPNNVALIVSNDLYIHRCKSENSLAVYQSNRHRLLVPPFTSDEQSRSGVWSIRSFEMNGEDSYDIAIAGIGFVHLSKPIGKIVVLLPKNIELTLHKNLL